MSASHPSSLASNVASTARPAGGVIRQFFREVWRSYAAHSEMAVLLSTGRWTQKDEQYFRKQRSID